MAPPKPDLASLPTEWIQEIAQNIPLASKTEPDALLQLRLTCQSLEASTFPVFGNTYVKSLVPKDKDEDEDDSGTGIVPSIRTCPESLLRRSNKSNLWPKQGDLP